MIEIQPDLFVSWPGIGGIVGRPDSHLLTLRGELLTKRLDKCAAKITHKAWKVVGQNTDMHPIIVTHRDIDPESQGIEGRIKKGEGAELLRTRPHRGEDIGGG